MAHLGDIFAAIAGHPVNRSSLDAFVAQSQELNGLRSAQTQTALETARQEQLKALAAERQQQAADGMEDAYMKAIPGATPEEAHMFATNAMVAGGNPDNSAVALGDLKKQHYSSILADNTGKYTPQDKFAAAEALKGEILPGIVAQPPVGQAVPGAPPPGPSIVSPEGSALIGSQNALAGLHSLQTSDPELFHAIQTQLDPATAQIVSQYIEENPAAAGNLRGLLMGGGASVITALMNAQQHPGAAPPNGISPAPGVSFHEQSLIRNDFANGLAARQTTSLNTMFQHSQLFDQIADQLHNGNFTPTNSIAQLWQRTFGSQVPSNLGIAASFLGREAVRATVNSGAGTGQERELAVDASSSPDQLHGAAQTLRALASGQVNSLNLRAQRGGVDIRQLITPEAAQAFGLSPAAGSTPGAAPAPAAQGAPAAGAPVQPRGPVSAPGTPSVQGPPPPPTGPPPAPLGSVAPVASATPGAQPVGNTPIPGQTPATGASFGGGNAAVQAGVQSGAAPSTQQSMAAGLPPLQPGLIRGGYRYVGPPNGDPVKDGGSTANWQPVGQ